jgi:MoaA/NifB/PqqE/SkfB family radical SAM enzyme
MTTQQWLKTLDELRGWLGVFPMVFTGGEALLRPDMIEILKYAVKLGIEVELLTNGLLVDDELAEQIVSSGIFQVTLSYDGATPETHDHFRGGSEFHTLTSCALTALARYRQEMQMPLKILLKTVISRNNLSELDSIARFARENGFYLRFQPIEENYAAIPDPKWYLKSDLWIDDISLLCKQVSELKSLQEKGCLIENAPAELDSYVSYFQQPDIMMAAVQAHDIKSWNKICQPALSSFVISGNGDVRMCYMMDPIGNLAHQHPQEIWKQRNRCWRKPCCYRQS